MLCYPCPLLGEIAATARAHRIERFRRADLLWHRMLETLPNYLFVILPVDRRHDSCGPGFFDRASAHYDGAGSENPRLGLDARMMRTSEPTQGGLAMVPAIELPMCPRRHALRGREWT